MLEKRSFDPNDLLVPAFAMVQADFLFINYERFFVFLGRRGILLPPPSTIRNSKNMLYISFQNEFFAFSFWIFVMDFRYGSSLCFVRTTRRFLISQWSNQRGNDFRNALSA